jgi:adenosylmethionine-8-amino-7-oxononanoate aminotransferase
MEIKYWSPGEQEKIVRRTHKYFVEYENGETHVDIQCGNMAYILGYDCREIVDAVAQNTVNFIRGNTGESSVHNSYLVDQICKLGNWASLTWAVSGSDAVEAAVAMNDSYWQAQGKDRPQILSFDCSYHGTTMLAKHLRGEYLGLGRAVIVPGPQWQYAYQQKGREQLTLQKIKHHLATNPKIGCLIMETVSWSTTMAPYSMDFWQTVRKLCTDHNVLMIVDDVAFCWGTNGTMFGYESYQVQPDICAIGKSLTAGYSPLGAAVCNDKVNSHLNQQTWNHGHTWQPNMSGVAAAMISTGLITGLLSDAKRIEWELRKIAEELDLNCRGANTYMAYDFDTEVSLAELSSVGKFAASLPGGHSVKVFVPLGADADYFFQLKDGLKRIQNCRD